jgi:hypothetical protein
MTNIEGTGTQEDPWILCTPPGKSEFEAYRDPETRRLDAARQRR